MERLGPYSAARVRDGTYARVYIPAIDCSAAAASERVQFIIVAAAWCAGCSAISAGSGLAITSIHSKLNRTALHKSVRRRRSQRKWNMLHQYQYHGNNTREGCVQMLWQGCYRHRVWLYCLISNIYILFTKKKKCVYTFFAGSFKRRRYSDSTRFQQRGSSPLSDSVCQVC